MKRSYTPFVALTMLTINAVIIAYFLMLAFVPVKVLEIHGTDKILNAHPPGQMAQIATGSVLEYQVDYCKFTDTPVSLTRVLVGEKTSYFLPSSTNNIVPGCRVTVNRNTIIPEGVPSGVYHLAMTAEYQVNPLQKVTVRHNTENFEIKEMQ